MPVGTETFPVEGEYSMFLASHGGSDNAFTADEDTNYYFRVAPEAIEGALDRFARFFTEPTLQEASAAREMKAVNSEFEGHKSSDAWHRQYLLKYVASPQHPFHRFSTGNLATLNHTDAATRVRRFWYVRSLLEKLLNARARAARY